MAILGSLKGGYEIKCITIIIFIIIIMVRPHVYDYN